MDSNFVNKKKIGQHFLYCKKNLSPMVKKFHKFLVYGILTMGSVAIGIQRPKIEIYTAPETQHAQLPGQINVLSANIARGEGSSFDVDSPITFFQQKTRGGIEALENLVRQEDIAIACFQEMEYTITKEHQPKDFAERTQLKNYAFGENYRYAFFGLFPYADGNAIHGIVPLYNAGTENLEEGKLLSLTHFQKLITGSKKLFHATVDYKAGENTYPLTIVCTHISNLNLSFSAEREQEAELKVLFDYAKTHTPAIIMGDFNIMPQERFALLKEWLSENPQLELQYDPRLQLFNNPEQHTYPATYIGAVPKNLLGTKSTRPLMGQTIDYIFVLNNKNDPLQLQLLETQVETELYYSDHRPLLGKIEIKKR